ncbi:ctr copper transporter [Penicillium angulare]|uniref:ctr copper transporter n=1 Tax=Penicillium angulare TaxID=116970 RepID=UPI0025417A26|nr:ctr copper transporter [Penicillium angulare]KAJ5256537.1 ctr copper transporter [Penicillium angulare]
MATSTGSSMDMDMSSGSSLMPMSDMAMTFFTSYKTPIFADDWTPTSKGTYAGTCIFIIVLALILRVCIAIRPILEGRLWTDGVRHGTGLIGETETKHLSGAQTSMEELGRRWSRWRVNPAASRATFEVLIAGIAYLLILSMLAIMTMNVGYFLSVLAGIWLGTFIMGSVASESGYMHC